MEWTKYNEKIRRQIEQIMELRIQSPEETRKLCSELISLGDQKKDSELLGFAYYYFAESCFFCNEYDRFVKSLVMGLEHQLKVPIPNLIAKSYNMLGINEDNLGNISMAMDYYLTSLKYSQDYELIYETGIVNANIGSIYASFLEYETAIHYLSKAVDCFEKDLKNNNDRRNLTIVQTSLASCYLKSGDKDTAFKWLQQLEKEQNNSGRDGYSQVIFLTFKVQFYHITKEYENRDLILNQLILLIEQIPTLMTVYDEVFITCDILKEIGYYDEFWRVLRQLESLTTEVGITQMRLKALKYKLQYYKFTDKEEEYALACVDYFVLSEQLEAENKANAKSTIELRIDLEANRKEQSLIQEENKLLLEKSKRDSLTGLPNRDWMNEYTEAAFERAYRDKKSLAVEILDIDYFKKYNDTFGHQAGDQCLKRISGVLKELLNQGIFCARYGGDEFIILYENQTDETIIEIAKKLQKDINALDFRDSTKGEHPMVTISQGIRNSVPREKNKLWDYFYAADVALYQAKGSGRNAIQLLHTLKE